MSRRQNGLYADMEWEDNSASVGIKEESRSNLARLHRSRELTTKQRDNEKRVALFGNHHGSANDMVNRSPFGFYLF